MRVVCVFKENRDYSRTVTDWIEDFYRRTGKEIEIINPDESTTFCEAYDVVEYPTVMVLGPNSEAVTVWKGLPLPLFDEISYYTSS